MVEFFLPSWFGPHGLPQQRFNTSRLHHESTTHLHRRLITVDADRSHEIIDGLHGSHYRGDPAHVSELSSSSDHVVG
jgi:hypothetical protein